MSDVVVPSAPPLATIASVELMHAGQWDISTGTAVFTSDDFAAAIGALDCPAVRRPVLKLGHVDPRFDGEPAVGWIDNLATTDQGRTLVGDYVGMPGWLGDVIASAYPDRSIEGVYDFRCQIGHLHPFVLTGVALLGVTAPGIGTLTSLQDVAALYGVAASTQPAGVPVAVTVRASREVGAVPNPRPAEVAAGVTTEDVRRKYYEAAPYSVWICEMQLDPQLQLITTDDNDGQYARVPVTIDGENITFGDPIPVMVTYVDKAGTVSAAASAGSGRLVYASRAESRPADPPAAPEPASDIPAPVATATETAAPAAPESPAAEPVPITTDQEDDMSLSTEVRQRLGLDDTADEAAVLAALDDVVDKATTPERVPVAAAPALPPGVTTIDEATLADLKRNAEAGAAARARQVVEDRDRHIAAARDAGKIPPARVEHWTSLWDADPEGTRATLDALAEGLVVPVAASGYAGGEPADTDSEASAFDHLFSLPAAVSKGA